MNWKKYKYSESLVKRSEILFDFEVIDNWNTKLEEMNKDKKDRKFVYPDSFIKLNYTLFISISIVETFLVLPSSD